MSSVGLVSRLGFGAVWCSMALCLLAASILAAFACASSSFLVFFCITYRMVLQTEKWIAASSCASCAVVIFLLLGLLQLHGPTVLGQFCCRGILVRERGQVRQDTILKRKGPGLMPLSVVTRVYAGVVACFDGVPLFCPS